MERLSFFYGFALHNRGETVDRDAAGSGDRNQSHFKGPAKAARYGGHVDAPQRPSSDEDSEELFPGFVEEEGNLRRLTGSGSKDKEKEARGREGADSAGYTTSVRKLETEKMHPYLSCSRFDKNVAPELK